jgi:hypothetical protein
MVLLQQKNFVHTDPTGSNTYVGWNTSYSPSSGSTVLMDLGLLILRQKEDYTLFKQLLKYHPKGRQRPGRPLKRLLDDMNAEIETDHPVLNS